MNSKKSLHSLLSCFVFIVLCSVTLWSTDDDIYTDIILINGTAVLADYDYKGEIIKKYSEIPFYFSSYKSHESIVRNSTMKYKGLSLSKPHKVFDTGHFLSSQTGAKKDDTFTDYIDYPLNIEGVYQMSRSNGLPPLTVVRQRSFLS